MDQPKDYKAIMLSGTFTDLREHRQRAIEGISKLGYMPRVMEHSGAQAEADVIDTSLAMVRDAVAYIGVISRKYGQTPFDPVRNPNELSITELEFNEAKRLGRPIVLFIMGTGHLGREGDFESDPDKLKKLNEFRERAKRMRDGSDVHRVYEVFDSLEQFSTAAATAIGNLVRYLERSAPVENTDNAPKSRQVISNIPINIPFHFVGREQDIAEIDKALSASNGRAAITTLHGLRGVGKTTLAAAYAERHRDNYRVTWWIKAETESTMRADLVGLGVQLGWVTADAPEEQAADAVLGRLRATGEEILLIYDNAIGPKELAKSLPRAAGGPRIIITSNAPNWGALATPVEIEVWPKDVGADFLMARTGRAAERNAAITLSEVLGGLPLAHEQAAAYCERVGVSLSEYATRFAARPVKFLDDESDAPEQYRNGLTVSRTFALAIEEAAKRHPAAAPLISCAALLVPEPIPLFLFSEAKEELGEPLASMLAGDGLDEAVAALRAFALVDRESIPDERETSIETECIRLHRLVRHVATSNREIGAKESAVRALVKVLAKIYSGEVYMDPTSWRRARRLDAIAIALVEDETASFEGVELEVSYLLDRLGVYREGALAAFASGRRLLERALAIREEFAGTDHPDTAVSLNNLAHLLSAQGDFQGARSYYERALAINERVLGGDHLSTAMSLNNLGAALDSLGELDGARNYYERALAISEKNAGPDHPDTALNLNNLGYVLRKQGDHEKARACYERALAIREKTMGAHHPDTATSLSNLGFFLRTLGEFSESRKYLDRALAICEKELGSDHPDTARCLNNLGGLLRAQDDCSGARPFVERALYIFEKKLGIAHQSTVTAAENTAIIFDSLGLTKEAAALREKFSLPNN